MPNSFRIVDGGWHTDEIKPAEKPTFIERPIELKTLEKAIK